MRGGSGAPSSLPEWSSRCLLKHHMLIIFLCRWLAGQDPGTATRRMSDEDNLTMVSRASGKTTFWQATDTYNEHSGAVRCGRTAGFLVGPSRPEGAAARLHQRRFGWRGGDVKVRVGGRGVEGALLCWEGNRLLFFGRCSVRRRTSTGNVFLLQLLKREPTPSSLK